MSIMRDNQLAKRNVAVLICAQAILGAQMPMIFTVGGLAGQSLASNACFATMPISMIVLGSMITASPLSNLMQKFGRQFGFFIGALGGLTGGIVGAVGLATGSFSIFLLGSFITGIYMSAQGFYRFAAADTATQNFRPKAISYVMAGGLASAIIGPQIVKVTADSMVIPFLGTYIAVVILNFFGSFLFLFLKIPKIEKKNINTLNSRSHRQLVTTPRIAVAMICAMVCYAMMNLVMTSTPLAVVGCGYSPNDAANVVSAHVIRIFLQWGLNQLEQGTTEIRDLPHSKKAIRRFAWDTSFYLHQFLRKPDYISSLGNPRDPVRFFRFWIACLKP